jgi:hypothetical protein
MDKDIDIKVKSCSKCILRKSKSKTSAELVNIKSSYPFGTTRHKIGSAVSEKI